MEERFEMFTVLMTKIRRNIQRIKNEEVAEYGLKSPHVSCMYCLRKHESVTATELCEYCAEDKAAISRALLQLEKMGYIEYKDDSKKRYKTGICLTESGKKVADEIVVKIDDYIEKIGGVLPESDRLVFYKSLRIICRNLEKICKSFDSEEGV
ncbi:MAG: winged helix-turn-helix transcriptional regulator [Clostridia bacterium]|nr:winged helix-turn-helix transcriptional regulator [Clostridia bacterium]